MATHDYVIANGTGAAVRSDLNGALAAIVSNNSNTTAPTTTYAYQWWADTTTGLLKQRNAANSAWVTIGTLASTNLGLATLASPTFTGTPAAPTAAVSTNTTQLATTAYVVGQASSTTPAMNGTAAIGTGTTFARADHVHASDTSRAALASPTFTGTPAAPTASVGTNTTQLATTAFVIANAVELAGDTMTGNLNVPSLNGSQLAGTRNRIINGGVAVDARNAGAAQTFTAAAAFAYSVDRWYGYCTGANVTGQRVTGATAGQFYYQFTGAASVSAIGFGQRIEQLNSADLANSTATLSVDLANSLLTTVTWTAYYATTADTFGTRLVPTRTQIATGTFTVTSTVTRYNTNISVPAAATTGIEIVFTVGAQTSGTWTIGNVQLEPGTVATPFERRSYGQELALCQRYYWNRDSVEYVLIVSASQNFRQHISHPVTMRAAPTFTTANATYTNASAVATSSITDRGFSYGAVGGTAGSASLSASVYATAEL